MYYRGILNAIALKQLTVAPEIPDFRLMVGTAEQLQTVPLLVYQDLYQFMPKPMQMPIESMKNEDVASKLDGVTYTTDDFTNNTFYLGSVVDGG